MAPFRPAFMATVDGDEPCASRVQQPTGFFHLE
jgi:hypothetical protein